MAIDGCYITTENDFDRYKKELLRLADKYGIHEWNIRFEWSKLKGAQGQYYFSETHRYIVFSLRRGKVEDTPENIARHEFFEGLLLGRLKEMAMLHTYTDDEIEGETHRIVNILLQACSVEREKENEKGKTNADEYVTIIDAVGMDSYSVFGGDDLHK